MSNDKKNEFYKIPSTPLKGKNSLQVFTRSQCSNQCSANCLVHKKRKRRTKAEINENNNNLELSSVESESTDQLHEEEELDQLNEIATTSKASINLSIKKMSKRKLTTDNSTRFSNLSKLSDDEVIEESDILNSVNRYNYYENFSNNLNGITSSNQNLVRKSVYPFLIGLLTVFLISICFFSTSRLNSIIYFDTTNYSFLKTEQKLDAAADQLKITTNIRAIELFKQELKQSLFTLNKRIDDIERNLIDNVKVQQNLNKQLIDNLNQLNEKVNKRMDEVFVEWNKYKLQIDKFVSEFKFSLQTDHKVLKFNFEDINLLIKNALDKYDADKTGIVDFASEFAGGEIVSTGCTENYELKGASYKILGVPIWSPPNIPRFVIQPNSSPGQCWYFKGNKGSLVIKLSRTILPSNFSYEHIPLRNAPDGHINSAPKHFEVRALDGPNADSNWLLGEFEYDKQGDSIQFFKFENTDKPVEFIEFNILENHGNEEFTCLYRIRVHGIKVEKED